MLSVCRPRCPLGSGRLTGCVAMRQNYTTGESVAGIRHWPSRHSVQKSSADLAPAMRQLSLFHHLSPSRCIASLRMRMEPLCSLALTRVNHFQSSECLQAEEQLTHCFLAIKVCSGESRSESLSRMARNDSASAMPIFIRNRQSSNRQLRPTGGLATGFRLKRGVIRPGAISVGALAEEEPNVLPCCLYTLTLMFGNPSGAFSSLFSSRLRFVS
jgi:hypothetical protein